MHATRTAIAAAVVAVAVLSQGACSQDRAARPHGGLPPDEATALLDKRVWLDHEPRGPNDQFHVLVFDRRSGHGVFQHGTVWKGHYEIFLFEAQAGRIDMKLPGSRKRVQTSFTVERARQGRADTRLTFERSPQGPSVYLGFDVGGHDLQTWLTEQYGN